MSLPDITFTNNLGTISFKRCVITITDNYQWNGSAVVHNKQVSIDGFIQQNFTTPEGLEEILTDAVIGRCKGQMGSLSLPWTTIANVKLMSYANPSGVWLDWEPIQVQFQDDYPDNNVYTLHFFGFELHNPRLQFPIPLRQLKDEYLQMPMVIGVLPVTPSYGTMRTKTGARIMEMQLTGAIQCVDGQLPENLLTTLTQRAGMNVNNPTLSAYAGYPIPFNLGDAIPEVKSDTNLAGCFVAAATAQWRPEMDVVLVQLSIFAQPQQLGT